MENYSNFGGTSGVSSYEIGEDYIIVQFNDGTAYLYNNRSTGSGNVEQMKQLAVDGSGLNGFINVNVKYKYAKKLR